MEQKTQERGTHTAGRESGSLNRRDFLKDSARVAGAGLVAPFVAAERASARRQSQTSSSRQITYHGYMAFRDDDRIRRFTLDGMTGKLAWQEDVALFGGPAVMALAPGGDFLYVGQRDSQDLSSFRIDQATGRLSLLGTTPLQGEPVYLSVDRKGQFVLSAYYHQKTAGVHAIDRNGAAVFPPIEWRYTAMGAHSIATDRSNQFVFVPHVFRGGRCPQCPAGFYPNAIFQFKFDEKSGRLTPNVPPRLSLEGTDVLGPRHLAFHPTLDIVYASNEQDTTASAYTLDPSAGTLALLQTVATVPKGEKASPCDIHITPSGKFLYVSNRGYDSIASFSVDGSTGRLAATGWAPTGPGPRTFALDPDGRFLVAAALGSDFFNPLDPSVVTSYQIDQDTGKLTQLATYEGGVRPMWVLITKLRG